MKNTRGFTLIELMIVIVVLGIIAAIAYPSFIEQVKKARRSDAKQALLDVAAKLEVFYQDNKGYPTTASMANLGYGAATFTSPEGWYTVGFNGAPTVTAYSIQAAPVGAQVNDTDCATYRIDQFGQKTATGTLGNDRCW